MKKSQDPDVAKQAKVEDMMRELRETVPNGSQNPDRFKEIMEEWIEPWDRELGKELLYQQIRLLLPSYSNSVASDLKVMRKPTLIIWVENYTQSPLKLAHRLHHAIPRSRLVIIPAARQLILF